MTDFTQFFRRRQASQQPLPLSPVSASDIPESNVPESNAPAKSECDRPQQDKLRSPLRLIARAFADTSISHKLDIGFGVLVGMTFLVVGRNYWGSLFAIDSIQQTQAVRLPTVLASSLAQEDLLRMSSHIRGYLITRKSFYRSRYHHSRQDFEKQLAAMLTLIETNHTDAANSAEALQLAQLKHLYEQWKTLPEDLFALSDQPLKSQPAIKRFQEEQAVYLMAVQSNTQKIIDLQAGRSPSLQTIQQLKTLTAFQTTFALMGASLRAYLLTQDANFKFEYVGLRIENDQQWKTIQASSQATELTLQQSQMLSTVEENRQQFLDLAPELLRLTAGDRYREDLFIFNTQAEPLAAKMLALLDEIVNSQQKLLSDELAASQKGLATAQWQTLLGSFLALAIALELALLLRRKIAGPIVRLTAATASVIAGDLNAKATVESKDEIGKLAHTFNRMTEHLKASHQASESDNATLEAQKAQLESKNIQINLTLEALQNTQAQLVQTEKMSSLGQMVAGIAHEINNPVSFIHGNLPHMQSYTRDLIALVKLYQQHHPQTHPDILDKSEDIDLDFLLEDIPRAFDSMQTGTQRIRDIVLSLRNFSRLDESAMKCAALEEGLDSTLLILQNRLRLQAFRPAIAIFKNYGNLPPIECYPGQLNQVFLNILSNAIDAIDSASQQQNAPNGMDNWSPQIKLCTAVIDNQAMISIADNGKGIALDIQSRIFDPFFTTKPIGTGTGMGLSISHKIVVEQHKGDLSCVSVPDEGATFYISLPRQQTTA
ncbi:MAG: ATP-binding protein [Phormidesmis sp.]